MDCRFCACRRASGGAGADYPNRPLRLVVGFSAGGTTDFMARLLADRMRGPLGQIVIVENKTGANGAIAAEYVARSEPDGYTLYFTTAGVAVIYPHLRPAPYDTLRDFAPVSLVAFNSTMLVVNAAMPVKSAVELAAVARANPGRITLAITALGSVSHLGLALFQAAAGVQFAQVPYRGAAPAVNDLLAQQVQMVFLDLPVLLPQIKAGKLRPIAVGAMDRVASLPEVPTTVEVGMAHLQTENWYGMVAPAKTPPQVVAVLNKATIEAMKDPTVVEKLASQGAILVGDTPEHFRDYIDSETKKWAKVIADAGVQTEKDK